MTYESMLAETVAFRGHKGDVGEAYYARPLGGVYRPEQALDGWNKVFAFFHRHLAAAAAARAA